MRIVIQHVAEVSVGFEDKQICHINNGLLLYIGIQKDEPPESMKWLIELIRKLKKDDDQIMCLSQFTLFAEIKGKTPSFHKAEIKDIAEPYFYELVKKIRKEFPVKVENGLFGKYLHIDIKAEGGNQGIRTEYFDSNKN